MSLRSRWFTQTLIKKVSSRAPHDRLGISKRELQRAKFPKCVWPQDLLCESKHGVTALPEAWAVLVLAI